MSLQRRLGTLVLAFGTISVLVGCSHAVFPTTGGGGGSSTSPMILTLHDAAPSGPAGVTVVSFEVTVTGITITPTSGTPVSLLSTPQTLELTQLQTNSAYLSTTQIASGSYTSLTLTYASPQYTFVNNSGVSLTVNGQACADNATCVVSNPTVSNLTDSVTFASPILVSQSNQTLIEADINLNDIIQTNFDLDFSQSLAATVSQDMSTSAVIDSGVRMSGQVGTVNASSNQFTITPAVGAQLTITTSGTTDFEFARANCANNDFTCITPGQTVDVTLNLIANGTAFDATEVDFDDAASTQQVSGMIVAQNGTPPTSVTMVVHNTIPPVASLPPGTPVTVNIPNTSAFVINNGSFILPTGLSFASTSDILVGQEMEARVASNSSISNGAFTTDRLALEQTQLEATVSSVDPQVQPYPYFVLEPLPPLFYAAPVNATQLLDIVDTSSNGAQGTVYENLTPDNMGGLTLQQYVTVGGFLFNTTAPPSIIATVVRGEVPGT